MAEQKTFAEAISSLDVKIVVEEEDAGFGANCMLMVNGIPWQRITIRMRRPVDVHGVNNREIEQLLAKTVEGC